MQAQEDQVNRNAIVLERLIEYNVESIHKVTRKYRSRVMILNENSQHDYMRLYYDDDSFVGKMNASVQTIAGEELKKFKKKDASDRSLYDGFSVARDTRFLHIDLGHCNYPYIVEIENEVVYKNLQSLTGEQVQWYGEKILKDNYIITNNSDAVVTARLLI